MRVLIPLHAGSDFDALFQAYRARGWEVVVDVSQVAQRTASFDLVHIQWPEALANWRTPSAEELARIVEDLRWWRNRCPIVGTVHNLAPHGRHQSAMDYHFFARVYEACHLVTHFSSFSRAELVGRHPGLAGAHHLVHRPLLYDDLVPLAVGRAAGRARFGFAETDFVIAAFGHLREAGEARLVEAGIRQTKVAGKRAFLATTMKERRRERTVRLFRRLFTGRRRHPNAGRLSRADMVALCEAADVLIIPRYPPHLNSGVMQLAMTFGTPMAAPAYGPYAEYLGDAGCALYPPKNASGLARAIKAIADQDHEALVRRNREVAADWGWPGIVSQILAEVAY